MCQASADERKVGRLSGTVTEKSILLSLYNLIKYLLQFSPSNMPIGQIFVFFFSIHKWSFKLKFDSMNREAVNGHHNLCFLKNVYYEIFLLLLFGNYTS